MWQNPLALLATDIDGDGLDDIITATPRRIKINKNNGPYADFSHAAHELLIDAEAHTLVDHFIELALVELNGDPSRKELAVLRHDSTSGVELRLYALAGWGFSLMRKCPLALPANSHLAVGDIEGNGNEDIVIFDPNGQYQVLRQTAPGQFTLEPPAAGGPSTHLVDITGNGLLDGICCSCGGPGPNPPNDQPALFRVALNDGMGGFTPAQTFPGLGSRRIAGAVDMDEDGDLDLLGGRMILFNHLVVGTKYCDATPNSTGQPASIEAGGTASLIRADLDLIAKQAPSQQFALFYHGTSEEQVPFGDGFRCIGGQLYRLLPLMTDEGGEVVHRVDYANPSAAGGTIGAGSTWRFQFWFRDSAGAGGGFNFSDALR